jgi:hypothetical protein
MLIPKAVFKLRRLVGEIHHGALASVEVARDGTRSVATATNGKVLGQVTWPDIEDDEFPCLSQGTPLNAALIPAAVAESAERAIPKRPTKPVLGYAQLSQSADGKAELTATDLDTTVCLPFRPADGTYPDTSAVFTKPDTRVRLGVDLLQTLLKTIADVHGKDVLVDCTVPNDGKPVQFVVWAPASALRGRYLIMPCVRTGEVPNV